jgi:uncharacterized protein (DUF58 family)
VRKPWKLLTLRGRVLLSLGLLTLVGAMAAGQRDVMRVGLLLAILPVLGALAVTRAGMRITCERSVEPPQVPLGSPLQGRLLLEQEGRLPAAVLLLEDMVPRELGNKPRFGIDRAGFTWRREIDYPLLGRVRGRFRTGPLTVRTRDPFGLAQLDRRFTATSEVMVTPAVVSLPALRAGSGVGSTGEARPHRVGVVGADDVLVREYREGDDVRRVHWRSTARTGELMVRREEQSFDPSAAIILDSRATSHAGHGMRSSLEWAVSAAASVALLYVDHNFSVEVYGAEGPLGVSAGQSQHASASRDLVLTRLTDLRASGARGLHHAVESMPLDRPGQLVIAVVGRLSAEDAQTLLRVGRSQSQGFALVLDVDSFSDHPAPEQQRRQHELAVRLLRENQWRVVEVAAGRGVADAWGELEQLGRVA